MGLKPIMHVKRFEMGAFRCDVDGYHRLSQGVTVPFPSVFTGGMELNMYLNGNMNE